MRTESVIIENIYTRKSALTNALSSPRVIYDISMVFLVLTCEFLEEHLLSMIIQSVIFSVETLKSAIELLMQEKISGKRLCRLRGKKTGAEMLCLDFKRSLLTVMTSLGSKKNTRKFSHG